MWPVKLAAAIAGCVFAITVVDDRAEWLVGAAFPKGVTLHRCTRDYDDGLPVLGAADCVAVLTRCHATDLNVLQALAGKDLRYLGMIGSRRKVTKVLQDLSTANVSAEWLDRIHGPIGLSTGAETPGEIGVAIAAEIVSVLRGNEAPR